MSYKVVADAKGAYNILENDTSTVIELGFPVNRARDLCRKMNLGSGFNGWTPLFLAPSYALPQDTI